MDFLIRDINGNTILRGGITNTEPSFVYEAHISEAGNLIVTIGYDEDPFNERDPDAALSEYEDEAQAYADSMTADDMRAAPDWSL